ncbi:hypothetical protein E2320_022326 [Naja naja]|nr:hypothetical protein E2320_022326 [Naja naja]
MPTSSPDFPIRRLSVRCTRSPFIRTRDSCRPRSSRQMQTTAKSGYQASPQTAPRHPFIQHPQGQRFYHK